MIRVLHAGRLAARLLAVAMLAGAAATAGQTLLGPTEAEDAAEQVQELELAAGADVYARYCLACHGTEGSGNLGPALAGNANLLHDQYVISRILLGGGGMPPFHARLSESQIAAVANYVRSLSEDGVGTVAAAQIARQWWRGAEGAEDLYTRVCSRCHGSNGGGDIGPPLASNPNLQSAPYVVGKILNGQGGMPAFRRLLDDQQIAVLASYIRTSWGNDYDQVAAAVAAQQRGPPSQPPMGQAEAAGQAAAPEAQQTYAQNCAQCHGGNGQGGAGPALAGNARLQDNQQVIRQILTGGGGMPAFGDRLSDEQIAAVATFEKTSWGNEFGEVAAQEVAQSRQGGQGQAQGEGQARQETSRGVAIVDEELLYQQHCQTCHGSRGSGGVAPALATNPDLEDAGYVVSRIVMGSGGMPPFGEELSSSEIAAVATHIRTSWGNAFQPVTIETAQDYHGGASQLTREEPRGGQEGQGEQQSR